MSSSRSGTIREEECSGHKHVEWDVAYASLPEHDAILRSPTFRFGTQEYMLQLQEGSHPRVELKLIRMDLSANSGVRYFMGVKRADGSYHHEIATEGTDKETSIVCTNSLVIRVLENLCKAPSGNISFFVRMNVKGTKQGQETCQHDGITTSSTGLIREEECSGRKHVEWDFKFDLIVDETLNSPEFTLGSQRYLLEFSNLSYEFELHLFRIGPSVDHRVYCIAGMKRVDGTCDHIVQNSDLKLLEECEMWKRMDRIYTVGTDGVERLLWSADGELVFFVSLIEERTWAWKQICVHDAARMTPSGKGRIREQKCSDHVQVEWDLKNELLQPHDYTLTCPVFKIEGHLYLMELIDLNNEVDLRLFRTGGATKSDVLFFLGAKRGDLSYDHRTESGVLKQEDDFHVWQAVDPTLSITEMISELLSSDGQLTLFFRIYIQQTPSGPKTCTHDMSVRGAGSVAEVQLPAYKQVDWNIDFERSSKIATSASFSVADQNYLWELSFSDRDSQILILFRMGPSINESINCWSFVKKNDGSPGRYGSKCEKMNLDDETCALWQPVGIPLRLDHLDGKGLIICFLVSLERTSNNECTPADGQPPEYFKPVLGEEVTFNVGNEKYNMQKVVLCFRVPIFKAMFSSNCYESRNGVVLIEDCKPDVFGVFLDFVYSGKREVVTSEICFALFYVAHKYLFDELKDLCLLEIEKVVVSKDNFFDAVKYALMYTDDAALRKAIRFYSENKNIIKSEVWQDFYRNNSKVARNFLKKVMHS